MTDLIVGIYGGVEEPICRLRRITRRGPVYLAARTGVPASTVWRIPRRNGQNRLAWIAHRADAMPLRALGSRRTGAPRCQEGRQDSTGGGWRVYGRGSAQAKRSKRRFHLKLDPRLQLSPTPHRGRQPARITR